MKKGWSNNFQDNKNKIIRNKLIIFVLLFSQTFNFYDYYNDYLPLYEQQLNNSILFMKTVCHKTYKYYLYLIFDSFRIQ